MPTLSKEELQVITLLENSTGARASDVVLTESAVIFLVKPEDFGKAIGKSGGNVNKLKRMLGKQVEIVQYSSDLNQFLKNVFYPVEVIRFEKTEEGGRKGLVVQVDSKNKGLAIGRGGERIGRARMLVKRHFDFDSLKIL